MLKRLEAYFSGRVQGVGFRYTTRLFARKLPIKGFVKNLPDGRVELIAEGQEEDLESLVKSIQESHLSSYIQDVKMEWFEPQNRFEVFEIRVM